MLSFQAASPSSHFSTWNNKLGNNRCTFPMHLHCKHRVWSKPAPQQINKMMFQFLEGISSRCYKQSYTETSERRVGGVCLEPVWAVCSGTCPDTFMQSISPGEMNSSVKLLYSLCPQMLWRLGLQLRAGRRNSAGFDSIYEKKGF